MRLFTYAVVACLAGLLLATPAVADDDDDDDWFKDARKRQREAEKRLREHQKKQQEWARERWEKGEDYARESRKRQREFDREQEKFYEEQYRDQRRWERQAPLGGYSESYHRSPYGQSRYQNPRGQYPGTFSAPRYGQPFGSGYNVRPYGFSGSMALPGGGAYGFGGRIQIVPLSVWP